MKKLALFLSVFLVIALIGFVYSLADEENATDLKSYDENDYMIEYTFTLDFSTADSTNNLYTHAFWVGSFDPANYDINVSLWTTDATVVVLPTIQGCSDLEGDYFYTVSVGADTIEGTGQRTVNTIIDYNDSGVPCRYMRIKLDGLAANPATATIKGVILIPKPPNAAKSRLGGWVSTQ